MTEKEFLEIKLKIIEEFHFFPFLRNKVLDSPVEKIYEILETFVKPKAQFKMGDKVHVYDNECDFFGIISEIDREWLLIQLPDELNNIYDSYWFHKKQCRKLRKKEK